MREPVQLRSTSSADAMIQATVTLLAEGGFPAVTVAAVAKAAGASNGSLYHRFGDRTGLLLAAQDRLLGAIERDTTAAFVRADGETSDRAAVLSLSRAAIAIFGEHRAVMRAFVVEARSLPALQPRTDAWAHQIAATITSWLTGRLGASPPEAEAAYRIIHALGVTQAVLDEPRISTVPLAPEVLAEALARAVLAVVGA